MLFGLLFIPVSGLKAEAVTSTIGGLSMTPTKVSPGAVFWNPATIGLVSGTQIDTNITLTGGYMVYDRAGQNPQTNAGFDSAKMTAFAPNPFVSISSPLGTKNWRFGYSTYFPGGALASFDASGSQRFALVEGYTVPWHHQFTAAYKINPEWTIALSGIYSVGFFKVNLAIDLEGLMSNVFNLGDSLREHPALTARAEIPHSVTHAFGGAVGVYYSPIYQLSFGLSVFSPVSYTFENELDLQMPDTIRTIGSSLRALGIEENIKSAVKVETHLPMFLQAGVLYRPYGYFMSELFGRYSFSSMFDSTSAKITRSSIAMMQNYGRPGRPYQDTFLVGSVNSFSLWQRWTLGLNTTYSSSAVANNLMSVSIADFDSLLVGSFLQYKYSERLLMGLEYAHSFMFDRTASQTEFADKHAISIFRPVNSDGAYRAAADRLGFLLKYAF